jgi:hypothetical protein
MKRNHPSLFIDQYGYKVYASSVKELKELVGPGRVFKIYRDTPEGTFHVGYGVGSSWFTEYQPVIRKA